MSRATPHELIITVILVFVSASIYFCNVLTIKWDVLKIENESYEWIPKATSNLLGYLTVILPLYLAFLYLKRVEYFENKANTGFFPFVLRQFYIGTSVAPETKDSHTKSELRTTQTHDCDSSSGATNCNARKSEVRTTQEGKSEARTGQTNKSEVRTAQINKGEVSPSEFRAKKVDVCLQDAFILLFYFAGLQISFGTSNYVQEKIMTQHYEHSEGPERFGESQFLVFFNRVMALAISSVILTVIKQPAHLCPLYKYCVSSTLNILASWSLYEALKYVNFPTQVVAKSCKPIPVMLMGKLVSKIKYKPYEYLTTAILSIGVITFMISTGNANTKTTTLSGILLLVIFVICDAVTANWQGKLFKDFGMSPIQMMCGTNAFSCVLTAVSLFQQSTFLPSVNFMWKHPGFIVDCLLLSTCSAIGQIFIYSTISRFGPLIFSIFSTTRQGVSILLSCIIFKHQISLVGIAGIVTVFLGIVLRIFVSYYRKYPRKTLGQSAGVT